MEYWDYEFKRCNRTSSTVGIFIMLAMPVAGTLIAYFVFNAPWWVYAGIVFISVIAIVGSISEYRNSGQWEIYLNQYKGGRIVSPQGIYEFNPEDLIGVANYKHYDKRGELDSGGYVLVFRNGFIDLNRTAFKIFELRDTIKRLWPEVPVKLSFSNRYKDIQSTQDAPDLPWRPLEQNNETNTRSSK